MGEALIRGFIATGVSKPDKICASVRSSKRKDIMEEIGITAYGDALDGGAAQVAQNSDIIFLAVRHFSSHNTWQLSRVVILMHAVLYPISL